MNSIALALLLFSGLPHDSHRTSDTTVVVSSYNVDIVLDNFFDGAGLAAVRFLKWIDPFKVIKNPAPEQFTFTETITQSEKEPGDDFSMLLMDEKRTKWAHIISNDTAHSFVRPPKKQRIPFHEDAIEFVQAVRMLFGTTSPAPIMKRFFFEKDTSDATITEMAIEPADARRFAAYYPRQFSIEIRRTRDDTLFTKGTVMVGIFENVVIYPKVHAWMVIDGVRMTLTLAEDPKVRKTKNPGHK